MPSVSAPPVDDMPAVTPLAPSTTSATVCDKVGEILTVLVLLAVAVSTASMLWLAFKVPVSPQDLKDSSWLVYYTDKTYVTAVLGTGIQIAVLFAGGCIGVALNKPLPAFAGIVISLFLMMNGLQSTQLRAGIATDSVRVGCFVWESSECRSMLGLSADNAPSMYLPTVETGSTGETLAPWYQKARHRKATWASYIFSTPLTAISAAFHTDELNAKLAAQRAAVARFRATPNKSSH